MFVIQLRHSGTQRKEQGRYTFHFIRAGRTGVEDYLQRVPETRFLQEKRITLVGLGCLGAPIAMELAQAGIGHLHLVDHDFVDPPSTVRWPMGTPAFGVYKVDALRRYICQHFPYTTVSGDVWQIGSVQRQSGAEQLRMADHLLEGTSLIIDASAEHGVQRFLSEFARHHGIPYVWVWGTRGSWGGVVGRVFPDRGACWACIESADRRGELPQAPEDATGELQPAGCGDPTFTGAGFDMHFLSISAVRLAVATLTDPHHGYPSQDCNVQVVTLRSAAGELVSPRWESFTIPRSDRCEFCGSG